MVGHDHLELRQFMRINQRFKNETNQIKKALIEQKIKNKTDWRTLVSMFFR